MNFYSTNKKGPIIGLKEALLNGLAPDGGLYMPTEIPKLSDEFLQRAQTLSLPEIAFEVGKNFFTPEVPENIWETIAHEALNFEIPLVELDDKFFVCELFHGPTCAFKDVAARVMARLFGHFSQQSDKEMIVLVATSGDTGSAVAHGFFNVPGIRVVILYPSGKVSEIQEKQLTGMGGNVTALEVKGTFDDCQKMVKQAFLDPELAQLDLISANSINIGRLLPQTFYYVYLATQLNKRSFAVAQDDIIVSVPSGNFGNLTAGLIAKRMGAPITKFIAATNQNDTVLIYLQTGVFAPKPSIATISNAMDVGNPSNFARMLELFEHDVEKMRKEIVGASFSDEQTKKAIAEVKQKYNYLMDPHGAVAYLGLINASDKNQIRVFLETAHPAKFSDKIEPPEQLKKYLAREKHTQLISNEFSNLKECLL